VRTNSFDLVKIREKSVEIRAKYQKTFTKSLKILANACKYEQKWHPTAPKITYKTFFSRSLLMEFLGKLGRIRAKIIRTPKILPAPTPCAAPPQI